MSQRPRPSELPHNIELPLAHEGDTGSLPLQTQLTRFILTGGLSALVDYGLLMGLMALGLGHTAAKAVSFIAGTTTAYMINRRWTFNAAASNKRFAAIVALYATTFALQVGIFSLLFTLFTRWGWSHVVVSTVAFVIAQGVATTVNFVVQRALIFRSR